MNKNTQGTQEMLFLSQTQRQFKGSHLFLEVKSQMGEILCNKAKHIVLQLKGTTTMPFYHPFKLQY